MKTNAISNSNPQLIALAAKAIPGVEAHGSEVGLVHSTADVLRTAYNALLGEAGAPAPSEIGGEQRRYCTARAASIAAIAARNDAVEEGREFCALAVAVLKKTLGRKWHAGWGEVGFHRSSFAIPAAPIALLRGIAGYFGTHPEREVLGIDLTAAEANARVDAIVAAELAVADARGAQRAGKRGRDAAVKQLRQLMVALRAELELVLGTNDGRWEWFGFRNPASGRIPEPAADVTVQEIVPGTVQVQWTPGARSEKCRVSYRVENPGAELVEVGLFADSATTLRGLPTDVDVFIEVSCRNRFGESGATSVVYRPLRLRVSA